MEQNTVIRKTWKTEEGLGSVDRPTCVMFIKTTNTWQRKDVIVEFKGLKIEKK